MISGDEAPGADAFRPIETQDRGISWLGEGGLDIDQGPWPLALKALDEEGWAVLPSLVSSADCEALAGLYSTGGPRFRSQVVMSRHGYGQGEYQYFSYPLPPLVERLRSRIYPHLAPLANQWNARMGVEARFPDTHAGFIERCAKSGQGRPTPLLLQYGPGDYNCLHQDLYGDHVFPMQLAVLLSDPGRDFDGGEFIITEQRPRMQTMATVVPLRKGDGVVFAVKSRPRRGGRGDYRVDLRHGVSRVRAGHRHTLGVIFHDAV